MIFMRRQLCKAIILALALTSAFGCSGGGDDDDDTTIRAMGQAFLPPQIAGGQPRVPAANAPVQVLDVTRAADQQVVATSTTNSDGAFDVEVTRTELLAIITQGEVRVAGLISPNSSTRALEIVKNFTDFTDIACEAGLTAVGNGSVRAADFDTTRIAILEEAAVQVLKEGTVNFRDPATVTAAALRVLALTNNGSRRIGETQTQ
jgi:hypothetical protein